MLPRGEYALGARRANYLLLDCACVRVSIDRSISRWRYESYVRVGLPLFHTWRMACCLLRLENAVLCGSLSATRNATAATLATRTNERPAVRHDDIFKLLLLKSLSACLDVYNHDKSVGAVTVHA